MTDLAPPPGTVRRAYYEDSAPAAVRSAQLADLHRRLPACGAHLQHPGGQGAVDNISVGGEHLHHYLWGIGLLSGVGAVAIRGEERHRRHPAVAVSYGAGRRWSSMSSPCCWT